MSKQITARELAEIMTKLLTTGEIDDADHFCRFIQDVADVVCSHCGGETFNVGTCDGEGSPDDWMIAIRPNECLPADGGIWKDYDTDISFINGEEHERES